MNEGRNITILKLASAQGVGSMLKTVGKAGLKAAKGVTQGGASIGGGLAEGLGVHKGLGQAAGAIAPWMIAGAAARKTNVGRKAEATAGRFVGSAGRAVGNAGERVLTPRDYGMRPGEY